jgi:hypothetical protein
MVAPPISTAFMLAEFDGRPRFPRVLMNNHMSIRRIYVTLMGVPANDGHTYNIR